jgi:hypothetical protein
MPAENPNDMPPAPLWTIVLFWTVVVLGGIWWVLYAVHRYRVEEKLPP